FFFVVNRYWAVYTAASVSAGISPSFTTFMEACDVSPEVRCVTAPHRCAHEWFPAGRGHEDGFQVACVHQGHATPLLQAAGIKRQAEEKRLQNPRFLRCQGRGAATSDRRAERQGKERVGEPLDRRAESSAQGIVGGQDRREETERGGRQAGRGKEEMTIQWT